MKVLHLAVAAAVLFVAALIAFITMQGGGRADARRAGARRTEARAGGSREAGARTDPAEGAAAGGAEDARDKSNAGTGPISITLRIVDPDDAPAGCAAVELDRGIDALRVAADTMGILRVQDLAPGVYDLRARHGKLGGALRFEARGALDLGTLRLTAVVAVKGHVYGPRGEPLPSALVEGRRAVEREGISMGGVLLRVPQPEEVAARAATGNDGAYELTLPTGEAYALRATARGLAPASREPALFMADASGIDFHLRDGALLEGRVVDARQVPVESARILSGDGRWSLDERSAKAETVSGADGSFSMVVDPGPHLLTVVAAGQARHRQPVTAPQTNLVIVLHEGISLRLQAVDAEHPECPAARVNVAAIYPGGVAAGETDDEGRLELGNLPARAGQRLCLWGNGYVALSIDLGPAQPVEGVVDVGVVRLARGGVVRGRVLDRTTGDPIGGARVGAFGGLAREMGSFRMAAGVSAQDGSFRLEGVPLDAHTLTATHKDFVNETDPAFLRGGSGGPSLFAEGSRETVRDVELLPAASVAGIVVAPDGSPVADADVLSVGDDSGRITQLLGGALPSTTTDGTGAFVVKGFRRGQRSKVWARHRDYGKSESLDVVAGAGEPATLQLTEPRTITGTVVDPGGAPIPGVRVEAGESAGTTDGTGGYLIRNVPKRLWIAFDHPDYLPTTVEAKVEVSLDLGRTVLFPGDSIAGVVVRRDGSPAPSVVVHAAKEPAAPRERTGASTVTDAKGRFEILGLIEGSYRLRTRETDAWSAEVAARTGARDVRIVLLPAGRLLGRVTGRGAPVADATVRAKRQGGGFLGWARSGADGTFDIASLPPEEPFDVVVAHDEFRSLRVGAVQASDRPREFVLQPGAEVSGDVVDGLGHAVSNAEVEVRVDRGDARTVRTDARGAFAARGLDEGQVSVRLAASNPGFASTEWLDVVAGARDVRLVAVVGTSISGIVRDAAGGPARHAAVQAIDAQGRPASSTWVWQEDGGFELRGLRPGTYTVRAQRYAAAGGQQSTPREVAGVATGAKDVEIRFEE